MTWDEYIKFLSPQGFARCYRMPLDAFKQLVELIQPHFELDGAQSKRSSMGEEPITCILALHCTIRYLCGCSYLDACDVVKITQASFYRIL